MSGTSIIAQFSMPLSEPCYKGTILQRNYRKMTIKWPFSYNFFVKFHGTKNWEPQHDRVISNSML